MEQNDCRFQLETTPSKALMKEAYGTMIWHSWRAWVYVAAVVLGLGLAGYHIYDANLWSVRGYSDAWKNNNSTGDGSLCFERRDSVCARHHHPGHRFTPRGLPGA